LQGKQAVENMTRGGGADNMRQAGGGQCEVMGWRRTRRKAFGWPMTQREERGKGHDARQLGRGQHNERGERMMQGNRAVEDTTRGRGQRTQWSRGGVRKCEPRNLQWPPLIYDRLNVR
jgi:hypothetical protein